MPVTPSDSEICPKIRSTVYGLSVFATLEGNKRSAWKMNTEDEPSATVQDLMISLGHWYKEPQKFSRKIYNVYVETRLIEDWSRQVADLLQERAAENTRCSIKLDRPMKITVRPMVITACRADVILPEGRDTWVLNLMDAEGISVEQLVTIRGRKFERLGEFTQ